jgi:hypothetical protein
MRLLNDKRGNMRVVEGLLASLLLLSSLTLIPVVQKHHENPVEDLTETANQLLLSLNGEGDLSRLVDEENWSAIRSSIQVCLSPMIWFNFTVFDENMICLNDILICSGNLIGENAVAVEYVMPSLSSNFHVYLVRLQVGRFN